MTRSRLLNAGFVMLLVALPLLSVGTQHDATVVWALGLVVLAAGFSLPLALRFGLAPPAPENEPDVGEEPS